MSWYVAACSLLSLSAVAQEEKPVIPTEQTDQKSDSLDRIQKHFIAQKDSVKTDSIFVKGKVTDMDGVPIIGANVIVKGSSIGASTNVNGDYIFYKSDQSLSLEYDILVFKAIGYETKEILVDGSKIIDIALEDAEITEFIVVAKRRTFFGRAWHGLKGIFRKKD